MELEERVQGGEARTDCNGALRERRKHKNEGRMGKRDEERSQREAGWPPQL
jgi:hypothetical protein